MDISTATVRRGSRASARVQAVVIAVAFALLLAGTNAINPLLPIYREQLRLSPFVLSLTFVCYVTVLVIALLVLSRPSLSRHASGLVIAALVVAVGADAILSLATEWSVLLGRMVAGIAGGLATGAAAALVIAAIGARGRPLSATGNLIGAVIGTAVSQAIVEWRGVRAASEVFLLHGAAVAVVLAVAVVTLVVRRRENHAALATVTGVVEKLNLTRGDVRFFATGILAWVAVSVAIVFSATVFTELAIPLVRIIGPTVMLGASAASQVLSPLLARTMPWLSGLGLLAGGCGAVVAGGLLGLPVLAVAGYLCLGAGIGIAYRCALVALTRGSSPARQGALSSAYAAVTYAAAAAVVLMLGGIGTAAGVVPTVIAALIVLAVASVALIPAAPRLRATSDRL